jgi:AraC family transcriptional regulator, ethanolamine operon transcriptional activator
MPLIKSVALSHGFWHPGQFSHDYRETFGEMLSDTLAQTRGCALRAAEVRRAIEGPI